MNKKIYGIVFYYGEGFERYKKYKFYSTQKEQQKEFNKYINNNYYCKTMYR